MTSVLSVNDEEVGLEEIQPQLITDQSLANVINEIGSSLKKEEISTTPSSNENTTDTLETTIVEEENQVSPLSNYSFDIYDEKNEVLNFSLRLDPLASTWKIEIYGKSDLNPSYPEEVVYKMLIYNRKNELKLKVDLYGKDTSALQELNDFPYEIGDYIRLIPIYSPQTLRVNGSLTGDISIEQEDYSDGVDDEDYIYNVRFEIMENEIKTVYNQQPIFEGLVDYQWTSEETIDPLVGIKVTDDHDGVIDLSKIQVEELQNNDEFVEYEYTVVDSWERVTTGKRGIKVTDDHDGVIDLSKIQVEELQNNDEFVEYEYTVVDSWERVTTGKRRIYKTLPQQDIIKDTQIPDYTLEDNTEGILPDLPLKGDGNIQSLVPNAYSLLNETNNDNIINDIIVSGVSYSGWRTERMKIRINHTLKILEIVDADGLLFNSSVKDSYFKFELYDKNMDLKYAIDLLGTDSSDSPKLDAINGIKFEAGDYIALWVYNPKENLEITGNINKEQQSQDIDSTTYLEQHRFRISGGLHIISNKAPEVIKDLPMATIKRGEEFEYLDILKLNNNKEYITDDHNTFTESSYAKGDIDVNIEGLDINKVGIQNVTYIFTDKWGASTKAIRQVQVTGDEFLDKMAFNVYTIDNELAFNILFDYQKRTVGVGKTSGKQLNPNNLSTQFLIRFYSKENYLKFAFQLTGNTVLDESAFSRLNGYSYSAGDRIEIYSISEGTIKVVYPASNNNDQPEVDVLQESEPTIQLIEKEIPLDYLKNGRFTLEGSNMSYEYNAAPTITPSRLRPIIARGEEPAYLDWILVSDDKDDAHKLKVIYTTIDTLILGTQNVVYQVIDSWGRASKLSLEVEVVEKNNLEKALVEVHNLVSDTSILRLQFDDDKKSLVVKEATPSDDLTDSDFITLVLYHTNGSYKNHVTLTQEDLSSREQLQENLSQLQYSEGDYLQVWLHEGTSSVIIYNHFSSPEGLEPTDITELDTLDKRLNTRFKILDSGLQQVYNTAPQFSNFEPLYLYKDQSGVTEDLFKSGYTITDDLDNTIEPNSDGVTISGHFDINTVGSYELTYTVTDSWGRSTQATRTVYVVSKSAENMIEFKKEGQAFLQIRLDSTTDGLWVRLPNLESDEETPDSPDSSNGLDSESQRTLSESDDSLNSDGTNNENSSNSIVLSLGIYNRQGKSVAEFDLTEEDLNYVSSPDSSSKTSDSIHKIEQMYQQLTQLEVLSDYYFSVWASDSSQIAISGSITNSQNFPVPDIDSVSKTMNPNSTITVDDCMKNTRFQWTDNGLVAVYNQAPKIQFTENFSIVAGDSIDASLGVSITDDHDETIKYSENIKVQYKNGSGQPSDNPDNLKIGSDNKVIYTVSDSWGRETTIERPLTITDGTMKNTIKMDNEHYQNAFSINIVNEDDSENMKLKATLINDTQMNSTVTDSVFSIEVWRPSEESRTGYTRVLSTVSVNGRQNAQTFVNSLNEATNNTTIKIGDIINMNAAQPFRVSIDGTVIDAREDYTDGFNVPTNLTNAYFKVTNSGLQALYKNPITVAENQNAIAFYSLSGSAFKLRVDPTTHRITVFDQTSTALYYGGGEKTSLMIEIYGANREAKKRIAIKGRTQGNNLKFMDITDCESWKSGDLNGTCTGVSETTWNGPIEFAEGDYLRLTYFNPQYMTIDGTVLEQDSQKINYETGFVNTDRMMNTVFKFTAKGLEEVYNQAPQIQGLGTEVNITESDLEIFGNRNGIIGSLTLSDDKDNSLTYNDVRLELVGNDASQTLGTHLVRYTVTDTWGRSTSYDVNLNIRTNLSKSYFDVKNYDNSSTTMFKIGFDSLTNTYAVFEQSSIQFSPNNPTQKVLDIYVMDVNTGKAKLHIPLYGNDRGTTSKLENLEELSYQNGDIIRVVPAKQGDVLLQTMTTPSTEVPEESTITISSEDDYRNIGYQISSEDVTAVYNTAPTIETGTKLTYIAYKGATLTYTDFKVNDDRDGGALQSQLVILVNGEQISNGTHTFYRLGAQTLTLQVTDSWGITTQKEITVEVKSKMEQNVIEIGNSSGQKIFNIKFDVETKQFKVEPYSEDNISDSNKINNSLSSETVTIIIRDSSGSKKLNIQLDGSADDRSKLEKLNSETYELYDTLELKSSHDDMIEIKGDIVNKTSTTFTTDQNTSQVRYQITDDGLTEIRKPILSLSFSEDNVVRRGDNVDYNRYLVVSGMNPNTEDLNVSYDETTIVNSLIEGTYDVTYKITDSWGNSVTATQKFVVIPNNNIETLKINVELSSNQVIMIGTDTLKDRLRLLSSASVDRTTKSNSTNSLVSSIRGYDSYGNLVHQVNIFSNDTKDSITEQLSSFVLSEVEFLEIIGEEVTADGAIIPDSSLQQATDEDDKKQNTRLKLNHIEKTITAIYNQAPIITGNNGKLLYYHGTAMDWTSRLKVTDDLDEIIASSTIIIDDSQVHYDQPGEYSLTYHVLDSWGREGTATQQIIVKSGMDENQIILSDDSQQIVFKFNNNQITVQQQSISNRLTSTPLSLITKPLPLMQDSNYEDKGTPQLQVNLYRNRNLYKTVTIYEQSAFEDVFSVFNNQIFQLGDRIEIKNLRDDEYIYSKISLQGPISNAQISYVNGVSDPDYLDNVRFEITPLGFYVVYNQAPTIKFTLDMNENLGDDYNFSYGVLIKDDHDGKITTGYDTEFMTPSMINSQNSIQSTEVGVVGKNQVKYTVTDSWGRTTTAIREITLNNALAENSIIFTADDQNGRNRKDAIKVSFDIATNNFKVTLLLNESEARQYKLNTKTYSNPDYYKMIFMGVNENEKKSISLSSNLTVQQAIEFLNNSFNNFTFDYGDYIKFSSPHAFNVKLLGVIRNGREDYSDGFSYPDNMKNAKFEISQQGLISRYTDPDTEIQSGNTKKNILTVLTGGGTVANITFTPNSDGDGGRITQEELSAYPYKYSDNVNENPEVFRLSLFGANGELKHTATAYGHDRSRQPVTHDGKNERNQVYTVFNNIDYQFGDYITFEHKFDTKYTLLRGPVENGKEDYSDGVDNINNLTKAMFKLTANGIEVLYDEPPKISNISAYQIKKVEGLESDELDVLNNDAKSQIRDYLINDADIIAKDGVTGELLNISVENTFDLNLNQIGYYYVPVSATNGDVKLSRRSINNRESSSDGSKASTVRNVSLLVYATPKFELQNPVIEMSSVTSDNVNSELLNRVTVTDEEDVLSNKNTVVVLNDTTLNPNKPGTYSATYQAQDSDGHVEEKEFEIQVVRTISVSVPVTVPFQVVTNLLGEDGQQADPQFIAGRITIQNNNPTPVAVYLKSFNVLNSSEATFGSIYDKLSLVSPTEIDEASMTVQQSMTKMALGLYVKSGFEYDPNNFEYKDDSITDSILPTGKPNEDGPIWLLDNGFDISYVPSILNSQNNATNQQPFYFGTLAPNTDTDQSKAVLSFTSIFSNQAKVAGKSRAKFQMVLEFR